MTHRIPRLAAAAAALVLALPGSAPAQSKPASMSTAESNKARFRAFFAEVVNAHDMARFDDFMSTAFTEHQVTPGYEPDYAGVRTFFTDMITAFPDMKATIDVIVAEGDLVSAHVTWTGTHKGSFMGAPASGKTVTFKSVDIVRLKDGKVVEHWGVSEDLAIMQQLGLVHTHH